MAKRRKSAPGLSPAGLAAYRDRLDAIGPWAAEARGDDGLLITWEAPPALAVDWLRLRLVFRIESSTRAFDPDDAMFELWESFRRRAGELLPELRERVREAYKLKEWSQARVDRLSGGAATVEVSRGDYRPDPKGPWVPHYGLRVVIEAGDDEHIKVLRFERGRFARRWELM